MNITRETIKEVLGLRLGDNVILLGSRYVVTKGESIETPIYYLENQSGLNSEVFTKLGIDVADLMRKHTKQICSYPFTTCNSLDEMFEIVKDIYNRIDLVYPIKREKNENNSHRIYKWSNASNALKLLEGVKGINVLKWKQVETAGVWYIPYAGGSIEVTHCPDLMEYVKKHGVEVKHKKFLTKSEKDYVKNVIRPWEKEVQYIIKCQDCDGLEFLRIVLNDNKRMDFPKFKKDTRYCGMKVDIEYSLTDLELANVR